MSVPRENSIKKLASHGEKGYDLFQEFSTVLLFPSVVLVQLKLDGNLNWPWSGVFFGAWTLIAILVAYTSLFVKICPSFLSSLKGNSSD